MSDEAMRAAFQAWCNAEGYIYEEYCFQAWQAATLAERERISTTLRRGGANLPAPELKGTIESSIITGLSIALAVVETP